MAATRRPKIRAIDAGTAKVAGTSNPVSTMKSAAPAMEAVTYISLRRTSGTSAHRTSRIAPPTMPVITPMTTTMGAGTPESSAVWAPVMVKSERPKASATSNDPSGGRKKRT